MSYYDDILELSLDNYGLVTYGDAVRSGVTGAELARLVNSGRLMKIGHGVYQVTARLTTPFDRFAQAVSLVGKGAYLYGQAVLALLGLGSVNPRELDVACPRRVRKRLPGWVRVIKVEGLETSTSYRGIASQPVADAIRSCLGSVMPERLNASADDAYREGLISDAEYREVKEVLEDA